MFGAQSESGRGRRSHRERYESGGDDGAPVDSAGYYRDRSRGNSKGKTLVKKQTYVYEAGPVVQTYQVRGQSLGPVYVAEDTGHKHRKSIHSTSQPPVARRGRSSSHHTVRTRDVSEGRSDRFLDLDLKDRRKWQHALEAAVDAAAIQAFRLRKEPGEWRGAKGGRVATAAISAAAIDMLLENRTDDPERHSRRRLLESAIGGLVVSRVVNGSRRELRQQA